ncbi:MAG: DMT family transporter [Firmicutes bacterium]|nr:DMT family transporter [Bacillota bacterium]
MTKRKAYFLIVIVALLFGSSFVIGRVALDVGFQRSQVLFLRGVIFLALISVVFFKNFKNFNKRDILFGMTIGVINFFAYFFQIWGLQLSPTNNAFLISTNIVLVPIFAFVIFRTIPSWRLAVSLPVAIVGSFLITGLLTGMQLQMGDVYSLISSVFFALNFIFVGFFLKKGANFKTILFFIALFQTIGALIMWSFMDGGFVPFNLTSHWMVGVVIILHLGAIVSFGAIGLQVFAQKFMPATNAAMIVSMESVFAAVLTVAIWPSEFSWSLVGGGLLIMSAVLFLLFDFSVFKKRTQRVQQLGLASKLELIKYSTSSTKEKK